MYLLDVPPPVYRVEDFYRSLVRVWRPDLKLLVKISFFKSVPIPSYEERRRQNARAGRVSLEPRPMTQCLLHNVKHARIEVRAFN